MSPNLQPFHRLQNQEVLNELLHSLSQPLTSLRCTLELSIDDPAGQQHEAVAAALEQADRVVGLVRLMREYLDTEPGSLPSRPVAIVPIVREVVEQLGSIAMVRHIRVQLSGHSDITIPVPETRLKLALQYLIGSIIEAQPPNREITLGCEEDESGFILRARVRKGARPQRVALLAPHSARDPVVTTMQGVKLAIASRVFESGGATLACDAGDLSGFVLRIPRLPAPRF